MNITVQDLFDAGVHFGHQLRRWNPRSKKFVCAERNGFSIIDLEKTYAGLEQATAFLSELVASGKDVLMVGTKRQAQEVVREAANATNMPFCVNRWMGGCLTNFPTIERSLEKYKGFQKMESDGSMDKLPKKEVAAIRRQMARMHRNFEGLGDIKKLPAAMFVVDVKQEAIAVREANRLGIPVVALVDTNSDPAPINYPIPGNDDSVKSISLIVSLIVEAIENGLSRRSASKSKRDIAPIVSDDFDDVEAEVTISADISLEDASPKAAAQKAQAADNVPAEASAEIVEKTETSKE